MHVISKKTLVHFYKRHPDIKEQLIAWHDYVSKAMWKKPSDVVAALPKTDIIDSKRVVFNIKGNHYRLIADIEYRFQKTFVVWIGTHAEYDKIKVKDVRYNKDNKD